MNELKIFEKSEFGQIRVNQNELGEPLFCLADVCKALKLQVQSTKQRLKEDGVSSINLIDSLGRKQSAIFISEQNLYKAILQSRKKEAELFADWVTGEVLPSIRKTGKYEVVQKPDANDVNYLNNRILVARFALEALNMNEVSRLAIVKSISQGYNIPLPEYASSRGELKSTTELLKRFGADCSTKAFNESLFEMGILQQNQRRTSKGKVKFFKSLTSEGLKYGENMVYPENPLETQVLLYVDKFGELFNRYLSHIGF